MPDQHDIDDQRALRRHVEAEREAEEGDAVELARVPAFDERDDEPDDQQDSGDDEVLVPVLAMLGSELQGFPPDRCEDSFVGRFFRVGGHVPGPHVVAGPASVLDGDSTASAGSGKGPVHGLWRRHFRAMHVGRATIADVGVYNWRRLLMLERGFDQARKRQVGQMPSPIDLTSRGAIILTFASGRQPSSPPRTG